MTTTTTRPVTAEELFEMGDIGRCELIRGEVTKMAPAGFDHGGISSELDFRLRGFVKRERLGRVVTAEAGFILSRNPDTVRAADVAFVRRERIRPGRHPRFFEGAPDLAIEVVSPSDRMSDVQAKVNEWLAACARSVWVVDTPNRSIDIFHSGGHMTRFRESDVLTDDVLPGFTLKLDELFNLE